MSIYDSRITLGRDNLPFSRKYSEIKFSVCEIRPPINGIRDFSLRFDEARVELPILC